MKFTKKMVEVIERAIDKKLTAEEIEKRESRNNSHKMVWSQKGCKNLQSR